MYHKDKERIQRRFKEKLEEDLKLKYEQLLVLFSADIVGNHKQLTERSKSMWPTKKEREVPPEEEFLRNNLIATGRTLSIELKKLEAMDSSDKEFEEQRLVVNDLTNNFNNMFKEYKQLNRSWKDCLDITKLVSDLGKALIAGGLWVMTTCLLNRYEDNGRYFGKSVKATRMPEV